MTFYFVKGTLLRDVTQICFLHRRFWLCSLSRFRFSCELVKFVPKTNCLKKKHDSMTYIHHFHNRPRINTWLTNSLLSTPLNLLNGTVKIYSQGKHGCICTVNTCPKYPFICLIKMSLSFSGCSYMFRAIFGQKCWELSEIADFSHSDDGKFQRFTPLPPSLPPFLDYCIMDYLWCSSH